MSYTINGGTVLTRQVKLSTTTATELVPEGGATIVGIYATVGNTTPALSYWKAADGVSYFLRNAKPMTAYETLRDEVIIVLKRNETLVAQAGTANQVDMLVSYIPGDRTEK